MSDQDSSPPVQLESREPEIKDPIKPANPFATKFSIWPPTQRTRDAVTSRLIETLSTPSILSKRYGTIPPEAATTIARVIEDEAYATADGSPTTVDDGIEILQVYSKEISKRMLEAVKGRAIPAAPTENGEKEGSSSPVVDPHDENPTSEIES
ncbi:MFP1 attachment factor 1-like [Cucurbita pepo subsp. pepo]|uniref:MFP1 attachment factor 1-like n=1 Tax=Cucurbita pepo subsp. pepo TaxID=3664 RepID=UPI000C9D81FA|nr:MFP1 attachment factor 1-like [Cucurbita pepo subsp. pepo]